MNGTVEIHFTSPTPPVSQHKVMTRTRLERSGPSNLRSPSIDRSTRDHSQTLSRMSDTEESVQPPRKKVRWEGNPESVVAADTTENFNSEENTDASKVGFMKVSVFWGPDYLVRYA